jgi:hypothetical protein
MVQQDCQPVGTDASMPPAHTAHDEGKTLLIRKGVPHKIYKERIVFTNPQFIKWKVH